jgi:hypothetical protein
VLARLELRFPRDWSTDRHELTGVDGGAVQSRGLQVTASDGVRFECVGPLSLRGVMQPVTVYRAFGA